MIAINDHPVVQVIRREPRGPRESGLPAAVLPSLRPPQLAIPTNEAELRAVTIESLTLLGLNNQAPAYLFQSGYACVGDVLDIKPDTLASVTGFGAKMLHGLRDSIAALVALMRAVGHLPDKHRTGFLIQGPVSFLEQQT